ncbi:MAG: hypothetical protein HDS25_00120 [Bacteroides sp.]|nr:hypothetical protein [Bacteroides sp.]
MAKYIFIAIILICCSSCYNKSSNNTSNNSSVRDTYELLAETDSIALYRDIITPAKDEYDIPECALLVRNKATAKDTEILRTVRPDWHCWYLGDGSKFVDVPIDSLPVLTRAFIVNEDPLQIIVEGSPDMRNKFSYFIDIPSRKAYWVPANSGFMGGTEEGYMVFQSYRYVSDPEIAGRYTFIQVFDQEGEMVDSLDMEHIILSKYYDH